MNIYTIKDKKSGGYKSPIVEKDEHEVLRQLHVGLKNAQSPMGNFADDYDLYKIGEFDDISGKLTVVEEIFIINLQQIKEKKI